MIDVGGQMAVGGTTPGLMVLGATRKQANMPVLKIWRVTESSWSLALWEARGEGAPQSQLSPGTEKATERSGGLVPCGSDSAPKECWGGYGCSVERSILKMPGEDHQKQQSCETELIWPRKVSCACCRQWVPPRHTALNFDIGNFGFALVWIWRYVTYFWF